MSWDDEDFDVPTTTKHAAASWEDEAEDEPVVDSWDVDEDEVARQKKAAEDKKKAELKKKQDEAKAKKNAAKSGAQTLLEIDTVDEATRREMLRKAELLADLNNAADLFGGLGVAGDSLEDELIAHPREKAGVPAKKAPAFNKDTPISDHPLFQPANKQEFEKLRKTVGAALTGLAEDSLLNYSSSLAVDLIRDLVQPLSVENLRKVISTLTVIQREKERQERQARLLKSGGTATGGAGKKKAKPAVKTNVNNPGFKKDSFDDMGGEYDDFGDDDFM
ncbi:translation initiation factor eIF3 subunit [Metschnikowia bicuspidata var. bicuspidata NRRL YB-4993]|uniref:Eukaryotic translation initiation factor 3 subunit J n=1 Tax=Metschnikowia bicuspidata var. bicuspidata NRRL YB-4993 TaxID=869754 RepID=A0A1A0H5V0_9ASCO|nr:translation initiation factor eIF3 subunit [Metschnikowia bicuspidata var. bicuspidata NRRL YB-4993]OBA19464.1 translation initiation factor eIF3 subunit [Metschnikowia bicuspidata var. bicuspidata NRRL YB-4993]